MIDSDDFTYTGRYKDTVRYHLYCDECKVSRGYGMKCRSSMLCKICTHKGKSYTNHNTKEFKEAMSRAKKGQVPWSKGKRLSKTTCEKISKSKTVNPNAKLHRKLKISMSNQMNKKILSRRVNKKYGTFRHLDYSVSELMTHLESKFEPGMTWDNHVEWHINHIIPDSWFTYLTVEDKGFKDSWRLSNLQPKWAKDNLSKGARFEG